MHQRAHDVRKRIAASLRMDPLMIYVQLEHSCEIIYIILKTLRTKCIPE